MILNRTDLAIEENIKENYSYKIDGVDIEKTYVSKEKEEQYRKKEGLYYTLTIPGNSVDEKEMIVSPLAKVIQEILTSLGIMEQNKCLIVGLGNDNITPDSLGPLVIDKILVTKHLFEMQKISDGIRNVSAMAPGVMGQTGMETSIVIKSICDTTKPDFLIVVDALASSSLNRVNKTIQVTTSGINPGSGIGNRRKEISQKTLGIPVIAIGVPTVVDAVSITNDVMNYTISTLKKEMKDELLGLIGQLETDEFRKLLWESLPSGDYMVTSKDIDEAMESLSGLIARAINISLHRNVN